MKGLYTPGETADHGSVETGGPSSGSPRRGPRVVPGGEEQRSWVLALFCQSVPQSVFIYLSTVSICHVSPGVRASYYSLFLSLLSVSRGTCAYCKPGTEVVPPHHTM